MGIIILSFALSLLWIVIVARIVWKLTLKQDPLGAVIPTKTIRTIKNIPKVLLKADHQKTVEAYIDANG